MLSRFRRSGAAPSRAVSPESLVFSVAASTPEASVTSQPVTAAVVEDGAVVMGLPMNVIGMADSPYDSLLDILSAAAQLPAASVTLLSFAEKAAAVGNRIVDERRGPFSVSALKARRFDATVGFQLQAATLGDLKQLRLDLQSRLLANQADLRKGGVLTLSIDGIPVPENSGAPPAWHQVLSYRVLYEFQYRDPDDAGGLIARIPISFIGEFNENTVVTDDLARWDENDAATLEVRRRGRRTKQVNALAIFAFLPTGFDGDAVTITVTIGGFQQQKLFATLRVFRDAFALEPDAVTFAGNEYRVGLMEFPNPDFPAPIELVRGDDSIQISYTAPPLAAGSQAVVYLRVL